MSLIINRYDYQPLTRDETGGSRKYVTPTGSKLPSVTTILDKTKSAESVQALQNWRNAVGEKKAKEITTEAANRGTRMHSYLEGYVLNGQLKEAGSNPYAKISHQMAQLIVESGLIHVDEVWGSEVALYYDGLYAGTTDLVGVWKGAPAIMDFKQANKPKKYEWIEDYIYQLAAYALAHDKMYGTSIEHGVILMCVRPTTDSMLRITEPPKYQEFEIKPAVLNEYKDKWLDRVLAYYTMTLPE